jgi:hypothetical protein
MAMSDLLNLSFSECAGLLLTVAGVTLGVIAANRKEAKRKADYVPLYTAKMQQRDQDITGHFEDATRSLKAIVQPPPASSHSGPNG